MVWKTQLHVGHVLQALPLLFSSLNIAVLIHRLWRLLVDESVVFPSHSQSDNNMMKIHPSDRLEMMSFSFLTTYLANVLTRRTRASSRNVSKISCQERETHHFKHIHSSHCWWWTSHHVTFMLLSGDRAGWRRGTALLRACHHTPQHTKIPSSQSLAYWQWYRGAWPWNRSSSSWEYGQSGSRYTKEGATEEL